MQFKAWDYPIGTRIEARILRSDWSGHATVAAGRLGFPEFANVVGMEQAGASRVGCADRCVVTVIQPEAEHG